MCGSSEHELSCCPPLKMDKICDCLDFDYRLIYNTNVDNGRTVPVEVKIRLHIELCTGPLVLGDLVYSTTLLPGEKVRLFSTDRHSRFSSDSAEDAYSREEQVSEEHFYMSSISDFMADVTVRDREHSSNRAKASSHTHVRTSDFLDDIFAGSSIDVSGYYNAYSTSDFLRELSQHVQASDRRAEVASRGASSISIGEVHTRNHAEGESEDQYESSSREFANLNKCHAVTYFFYRINKIQTLKVTLEFIECRVIEAAANTKVTNNPLASDESEPDNQSRGKNGEPLSAEIREQARLQVEQELVKVGLLSKGGTISSQAQDDFCYERRFSLPTPGIIIKGCLDECNVCEPILKREYELELEQKSLENQRLRRQLELGEKL